MNKIVFVESIKRVIRDYGVTDLVEFLENPPGRKSRKKTLVMSKWYNQLNDDSKEMLKEVITESIDSTLHAFFSLLDGRLFIEDDDDKGQFELYYNKGEKRKRLNDGDEDFHDIYNYLVQKENKEKYGE